MLQEELEWQEELVIETVCRCRCKCSGDRKVAVDDRKVRNRCRRSLDQMREISAGVSNGAAARITKTNAHADADDEDKTSDEGKERGEEDGKDGKEQS